ncbi:hypothetical protein CLMAG_25570 [Clostridium magnum DSM 2767]|uniref:Transposase DDE domain protein n=2 Tax=Clostridium magnum TaxID=33954 RepID=A0A162TJZ7_9CLOT|nr:hypothetical protein CLMAG_25570 [Clostridium magnum DSM 2767]SHI24906.1 hypothetical protein SAMN02745944_03612 [Clostridium magnum DSM 2767]
MLGSWRSHSNYQNFLLSNIKGFYKLNPTIVEYYSSSIEKLYNLDFDVIKPLISETYSLTGKPSNQQPELFRSFILMSDLGFHSLPKWLRHLRAHDILCSIVGVSKSDVPGLGTHYDFISRFWGVSPETEKSARNSLHPFVSKPRKKLGKNEKLPPKHPGVIKNLVEQALKGRTIETRPEKLFQQIFAKLAVEPSVKLGLLGDTKKLDISGDGTCIETGGSSLGTKTCDCIKKGIYNCKCNRRFSDPDARRGWDSYHEKWYYGHCLYFLSVYNPKLKKDLPIYFRMVQAQRYDGVTAIFTLSEVKKMYPLFNFDKFIADAAHDNYPTYKLLNKWNIKAVISLNPKGKGKNKYEPPIGYTKDGAPICKCNQPMIYDWYDKDRSRIKYRCPLVKGKISNCTHREVCSPSAYGRVIYVKPSDDLRLFTPIPRNTDLWKQIMKKRTSSERVNKRLLEDYNMEEAHCRGKKRWSWWTLIHSINIHLDAQLSISKTNILDILESAANKVS